MTRVELDARRRSVLDLERQAWLQYDTAYLGNRATQEDSTSTPAQRADALAQAVEWLGVWRACFAECDRLQAQYDRPAVRSGSLSWRRAM